MQRRLVSSSFICQYKQLMSWTVELADQHPRAEMHILSNGIVHSLNAHSSGLPAWLIKGGILWHSMRTVCYEPSPMRALGHSNASQHQVQPQNDEGCIPSVCLCCQHMKKVERRQSHQVPLQCFSSGVYGRKIFDFVKVIMPSRVAKHVKNTSWLPSWSACFPTLHLLLARQIKTY